MTDLLNHYARKILTSRVYDVAVETPLHGARQLSERLGNQVLLKREDLQPVFSFKIRGAYNKLAQLSPEELARGVVTASAGNHAQGLALAAKTLGVAPIDASNRTKSAAANLIEKGYEKQVAHCATVRSVIQLGRPRAKHRARSRRDGCTRACRATSGNCSVRADVARDALVHRGAYTPNARRALGSAAPACLHRRRCRARSASAARS